MTGPMLSLLRTSISIAVVLVVTALYYLVLPVNPTTVALTFVAVVLLVAGGWGVVEATTTSVAATICLNVFFLPPIGTLTIADPQNWVALAVFLVTGVVASQLSGRARRRTVEAEARQRDLEQLYALSRALLLSPGRPTMAAAIARHIADAFGFDSVAVFDHRADNLSWAGPNDASRLEQKLREVARQGVTLQEGAMLLVAIRLGGAPIGSVAIPKGDLSDTVVQSIASLAAIGLERARGLEATARAEAAQESGQLRATMLDALAHEFKTPLTSMKVAAADLRDDRVRPSVTASWPRSSTKVSTGCSRWSPTRCRRSASMRATSASVPIATRCRTSWRGRCGQFEARLDGRDVVDSVPESLSVHADRELLGLALRQLLDNAVKYSPPGSAIEIAATGGPTVDITVRNSGAAIPEREQARLFERFYRGAQARRVPGTGMGLAIVRQIAEAHRGSVRVRSAPGAGTEFVISLPQEDDQP